MFFSANMRTPKLSVRCFPVCICKASNEVQWYKKKGKNGLCSYY